MPKVEFTETFTREQFARRLRALADALEMSAGYRLVVQGREVIIPTTAKIWEIEYEADEGRHEVEFSIEWGPRAGKEEWEESESAPESTPAGEPGEEPQAEATDADGAAEAHSEAAATA